MIGKNISFINGLTIFQFLVELIVGSAMNFYFFKVGYKNFSSINNTGDLVAEDCQNYITYWLLFWSITGFTHAGTIFCRYIFIRYPEGLLLDGTKILKIVVVITVILFSFLIFIVHSPTLREKDFLKHSMKLKLCSMSNLDLQDEEFHRRSSIQPKLLTCAIASIFGFYILWMFCFSHKHAKKFKITKYRRNLYTLRSQSFILLTFLVYDNADQILNAFLETFSQNLGPYYIFCIWWTSHLVEKIVYSFVKNSWLIYSANRNFPEFCGYFAKPFPGKEKPRSLGMAYFNLRKLYFLLDVQPRQQHFSKLAPAKVTKVIFVKEANHGDKTRKKAKESEI